MKTQEDYFHKAVKKHYKEKRKEAIDFFKENDFS